MNNAAELAKVMIDHVASVDGTTGLLKIETVPAGGAGAAAGGANSSNYGPDNADTEAVSTTNTDLISKIRSFVFDGTAWQRLRSAVSLDAGLTLGVLTTHLARILDSQAGTLTSIQDKALATHRNISATHVAQQVVIELRNLATSLSIHVAASAGTATLVVEASADNANWLQVDSIAAAQFQAKVYGASTAGAAAAAAAAGPLAPLSFRYVRITAGDAGVGNTTTLTVGAK